MVIGVFSRGILRIPHLASFLGEGVRWCTPFHVPPGLTAVAGWALRPTGRRSRRYAELRGLPYLSLEDGFLRSHGLAVSGAPPLSLVIDDLGIYYDATRPSRLEVMLNEGGFTGEGLDQAGQVLTVLRRDGLSKYNHAPQVPEGTFPVSDQPRILVVDQTEGDASIRYGLAGPESFHRMLEAALDENPGAAIFVKTHPDVLAGKKRSCFDLSCVPPGVQYLAKDWHPHSLLHHFDRVYVVTSQMGFDALLLGKPVTCFGMPFYAGWGLTEDRVVCPRRTARRSLTELVAAAYLKYPRYLKPETGDPGTFFDVAELIARQKRMAGLIQGKVYCFGFPYWKRAHVRPFFGAGARVLFVRDIAQARGRGIGAGDSIAVWGQKDGPEVGTLSGSLGADLWRVEDGFIRSVGLGSDFVPPYSLAFDRRGIYFDPSRESDLEYLLNHAELPPPLLERAERVRRFIAEQFITKYNVDPLRPLTIDSAGRRVVLVPGQVEGDASIQRGAGLVRTNEALLRAVRTRCPNAFLVYKPHPDVQAWNRRGWLRELGLKGLYDHAESRSSLLSCIDAADEVHTITSLSGFDALLRGRTVVTYGVPFYSGWGLTVDVGSPPARRRRLTLDELVAGTLLLYPRYWDAQSGGFVEVETILQRILENRSALRPGEGGLLRCAARRQVRRWAALLKGLWAASRLTG